MARVKLDFGAEVDFLTKGELDESLTASRQAEIEQLRGKKPLRFMEQATPASSAVTIGDPGTANAGAVLIDPGQGYVWSLRHLVIEGLTSGATPDVMNVYRNARIIWQLNGNAFCQTFGRGEVLFNPGEALYFKSSGTMAATGQITVHGTIENLPAELIGKFY